MSRMTLALFTVCVIGAIILALVDRATRAPIAEQQRQEVLRALDSVLPPHTNSADQDSRTVVVGDGSQVVLYLARRGDNVVGTALAVTAPDGYSGDIDIMVGIDRGGRISGVAILSHAETPGLGDKMTTDRDWLPWFRGRSLTDTQWGVKKDGGDVDQFTGATITPRAVVGAIHRALELCASHCRY